MTPNDRIIVDTNVLLYVHNIQRTQGFHARIYTDIWGDLLSSDVELLVTSEIINEYFNKSLKDSFRSWQVETNSTDAEFKRGYRTSTNTHYLESYQNIVETIKQDILTVCTLIDTPGTLIKEAMDNLHPAQLDITDELTVKNAVNNRYAILTADADFFKLDLSRLKIYTYQ